ncbi:type II secretion system GspH family protein [Halorhodospira sp. 9621]|uniref:PulJ/GspJ family protein n=1 Tax=Halorhodospira sp. 9621 TaxID=2899135 RepID=UPI001EE89584|nr:prepilin-type N-terminal cleavage/methylation domain-containing protein [Halorhodospira sp. 9621]MCG5534347.1 type II secretion system GspH family protein [Halorhodospira sp. 9621]
MGDVRRAAADRKARPPRERGVTLIELVIVLSIAAVVAVMVTQALVAAFKGTGLYRSLDTAQVELNHAFGRMANEIRRMEHEAELAPDACSAQLVEDGRALSLAFQPPDDDRLQFRIPLPDEHAVADVALRCPGEAVTGHEGIYVVELWLDRSPFTSDACLTAAEDEEAEEEEAEEEGCLSILAVRRGQAD